MVRLIGKHLTDEILRLLCFVNVIYECITDILKVICGISEGDIRHKRLVKELESCAVEMGNPCSNLLGVRNIVCDQRLEDKE